MQPSWEECIFPFWSRGCLAGTLHALLRDLVCARGLMQIGTSWDEVGGRAVIGSSYISLQRASCHPQAAFPPALLYAEMAPCERLQGGGRQLPVPAGLDACSPRRLLGKRKEPQEWAGLRFLPGKPVPLSSQATCGAALSLCTCPPEVPLPPPANCAVAQGGGGQKWGPWEGSVLMGAHSHPLGSGVQTRTWRSMALVPLPVSLSSGRWQCRGTSVPDVPWFVSTVRCSWCPTSQGLGTHRILRRGENLINRL